MFCLARTKDMVKYFNFVTYVTRTYYKFNPNNIIMHL